MISFFNQLTVRVRGVTQYVDWDYTREGLSRNIDKVVEYNRSTAFAVPSKHELIKILFGLATSIEQDLQTYYRIVDNKAMALGQQLGFTTPLSKGRVFNNVFFAGKSKEVIMISDESFDPVEVTANWRTARPIRILRHGFDHIDGFPLNGTIESNGTSVFVINIAMLAVQYRAFRHWDDKRAEQFDLPRASIYQFCHGYPINNMIYDAVDHAVFNRLVRINQGLPTSDNEYRHPFHFTNYTVRMDRVLKMIDTKLRSELVDLGIAMYTIPTVYSDNVSKLIKLPDIYESRQNTWAVYLARIDMLLFLLSMDNDFKKTDQSLLNKLKYELRRFLGDNTLKANMPRELYVKQEAVIKEMLKKL